MGLFHCHCQPLYPPYLRLWLEFEDGSKLKIIILCLAPLPVDQKRGVSRDPPYLGLWLEFEDGSKLNHAILDCSRGSNDTECAHKQFITTFGTWNTGVEMSDVLMAEWRHRYNQHVSERRRLGFPRIGHYDTWLIDYLQLIVEHNHGVLLYPDRSNASDYATTRERFGTVAIHSHELADAINNIELDQEVSQYRLTADQQYLC
jgi:hypothetical protein